jgi:UDP-N-acetylmuramoyl-tripeptide--D-alanyl-D-alanine ligase
MEIKEVYRKFAECSGVSTDTRAIEKDNMFFALKGPNFNGNKFADQAIKAGAKWAVIDEEAFSGDHTILVDDVLHCLQQLALMHRKSFDIPIFAITGSNGKTTSKELIRDVLKQRFKVHATSGNLNNHIGIPLTLLRMPRESEFAIIEMGANAQGEIHNYCQYTDPSAGFITNIGKAHLEGFGGIEGVEKGKTELFRYLQNRDGLIFYRYEDSILKKHATVKGPTISYGEHSLADYTGKIKSDTPTLSIEFEDQGNWWLVDSKLVGGYNFHNLMAAVAIGLYFDVPAADIKDALEAYIPENNRSQMVDFEDHRVILDAYNANPSSMELAIENLAKHQSENRIAVLGQMNEVGPDSEAEHLNIAKLAKDKGLKIMLVGPKFKEAALQFDLPHFEDVKSAETFYKTLDKKDGIILIKGSRSNLLEKLVED